jgi:predicted ATPase/DNA-binding SARP family transcriptional activator
MSAQLEIVTLGGLRSRLAGVRLTGLQTRKAEGLLVFLACQRRIYAREVLGDLLWEEKSQSRTLANLRVVLHNLRQVVGDFVTIDRSQVSINQDAPLWLDVAELEKAFSGWVESQGKITPEIAAGIERAAALYRGDFLEGFYVRQARQFEDWLVRERERLRHKMLDALGDLVAYELHTGAYQSGAEHAYRLLELEPLMESAHRQLMRLLEYSGQRPAALEAYQRLEDLLDQELGVKPEAETQALYRRLQAGNLEQPAAETVWVEIPDRPPFLENEQWVEPIQRLFAGRERELARLDAFLEKTLHDSGGVIFITGSAGLGKTTLMEEFARRAMAAHPELLVASGSCSAYTGIGDAYQPFRDILEMLAGDLQTRWEADAIQRAHVERLWQALPVVAGALLEKGPDLLQGFISGKELLKRVSFFSTQTRQVEVLMKHVRSPQASLSQQAILSQYQQALNRIAQDHPLLLLLDDMQWSDRASIDLLFHLGRQMQGQRILLLVAYRHEETAADRQEVRHPLDGVFYEFKRLYGDVHIDLDATSEAESRRFVETFLDSESNDLGAAFREDLYRRTRGHALFLSELLGDLKEHGVLVQDQIGHWVQAQPLNWNQLPARVEGMIEKRLSLLSQETRQLLTCASVEGEQFCAQVLAQVMKHDLRHVLRLLADDLTSRYHLVEEIEPNQVDHMKIYRYRFRHVLFQTYLHENLSRTQQELYHAQVGQALEAIYGEHSDEIASQLVSHFELAGDAQRVVKYALQAGDRARQLGASQDAIELYVLALSNYKDSVTDEQARSIDTIHERLGDVYLVNLSRHAKALEHYRKYLHSTENQYQKARTERKIASILTLQGDLEQAEQQYQSALRRLEPHSSTAEAGLIHCDLGYIHIYRGELDAAQEHARMALDIGERLEDASVVAYASNILGQVAAYQGEMEASNEFFFTSLDLYRKLGDLSRTAKILNNLGEISRLLGKMKDAQNYLEEGLEIARRIGDKRDEAAVLSTLGDVYRDLGLWKQAVAVLEQALPIALQSGVATRMIEAHWFLGAAYQKMGDVVQAKQHLQQAERLCQDLGYRRYQPMIFLELACLYSSTSNEKEALEYLERARQQAGEEPDEDFLGHLQCVYGDLYQHKQDWEAAIRCYQKAVEHFNQVRMPTKAARAHLGLGSSYLERRKGGDLARAQEHLQTAKQEYQRIDAQVYLRQAAAQLKRLERGVA